MAEALRHSERLPHDVMFGFYDQGVNKGLKVAFGAPWLNILSVANRRIELPNDGLDEYMAVGITVPFGRSQVTEVLRFDDYNTWNLDQPRAILGDYALKRATEVYDCRHDPRTAPAAMTQARWVELHPPVVLLDQLAA